MTIAKDIYKKYITPEQLFNDKEYFYNGFIAQLHAKAIDINQNFIDGITTYTFKDDSELVEAEYFTAK